MLIGITGGKGSGKDTLAQATNGVIVKMADPLKNMLRALYDIAGVDSETIERKIEGDLKEEPCPVLGGKTPRYAMQTIGTEWRNMIDRDLWTNIWRTRVTAFLKEGTPVLCTDIRFRHEEEAIKEMGGVIVRVDRPGIERTDDHVSETEMNTIQADATFSNIGSIRQLQQKFRDFLNEL